MDMDDAPVFSLKKSLRAKHKTSLRSKETSTDLLNDDEPGNVAIIRKKRKMDLRSGTTKRKDFGLSFAEEDQEESEVSTKKQGRGLIRSALPISYHPPESLVQATISDTRPIYDAEYLASLRADNLRTSSTLNSLDGYDNLTESKFSNYAQSATETPIPTSTHIESIKARRSALRTAAATSSTDESYISLDVTRPVIAGLHGESRFVREEDELGEGDEDVAEYTGTNETIALGKKAKKQVADERRQGIAEMILDAEQELDESENEEMKGWQEEQAKRGVQWRPTSQNRHWEPRVFPEQREIPTVQNASHWLNGQLRASIDKESELRTSLDKVDSETLRLIEHEGNLKQEVERVESKKEWFESFKDFVDDLRSFLDVKIPILEKIEKDNFSIQSERSKLIAKRRFEDLSDAVSHFTDAEVSVIPPKPKRAKLDDDGSRHSSSESETEKELDDMGRERRDKATNSQSFARVTRRNARNSRLQSWRSRVGLDVDELQWSDSDMVSSDLRDLTVAGEDIERRLLSLWDDVKAREFRDPDFISRFQQWRQKFKEDYEHGWGDLALASAWEFWVRYEIADWNVFGIAELKNTSINLSNYRWHDAFLHYSHIANDEGDCEDTPTATVLKTIFVPKLKEWAIYIYDPYSMKETKRAILAVEEMASGGVAQNILNDLAMAFVLSISKAIHYLQSLILPHLSAISNPPILLDPPRLSSRLYFLRSCLRLLRSSIRWKRLTKGLRLPVEIDIGRGMTLIQLLNKELLDKVVAPILRVSWETGGKEMWTSYSVEGQIVHLRE